MSNSEIITAGIQMQRAWAMPNSRTFSILPIKSLVESVISDCERICDPFACESPFETRCVSNDLDTNTVADYHMDALEFLQSRDSGEFDAMLFDPPYSPRQVSECYKAAGASVNMATTQASFWSKLKSEIQRVTSPGAVAITCGWNSGGIGKKYGFAIKQILLVAHGGWHNDTIVTVEQKPAQKNMEICHTSPNNRMVASPKC